MDWIFYVLEGIIALAISAGAGYALRWSAQHRQWRDFGRGAISIFDAGEPLGEMTDHFPAKRRKTP